MDRTTMEKTRKRTYNPMNDLLFKFVFGSDERKQITIQFLNDVLGREGQDLIVDIQFKFAPPWRPGMPS